MALYLLSFAAQDPPSWPATTPALFEPLLLVSVFIPILILFGLGQMRVRPLAVWAVAALVIVAALGWFDVDRARLEPFAHSAVAWPWTQLWLSLPPALFIAHVLVVDAVLERRWTPSYPLRFETAWKMGVQAALAVVFVGVFWGVLRLGAALFDLINIHVFTHLLDQRWFDWPATTLALAVAIHATDVQPSLIRGARSVALTLFSWLLPLLALIIAGFLASLPFMSLKPLWETHFATSLLLGAAAGLVFLINTAYQDGAAPSDVSPIKRIAGTIGAVELVPLVALAAWGLGLRVGQYGWSVERVCAGAAVLIAACYGVGYASAVAFVPSWLKRLETANFVTAYVVLALFLALFTPIADPARLMTVSQVARLKSGAMKPGDFDFAALKFDGARWGGAALGALAKSSDQAVRDGATHAQAMQYRGDTNLPPPDRASQVVVYPAGAQIPPAFLDPDGPLWASNRPNCFNAGYPKCVARVVSLGSPPMRAILVDDFSQLFVFEPDSTGAWRLVKTSPSMGECANMPDAVATGDVKLAPHPAPDFVVGGHHVVVSDATAC